MLIKTPNNKNEIGSFRDKFMPNPKAKGKLKNDMFYFLGNLMLHAICSGNVLNLNLHPIFYKKLLKNELLSQKKNLITRMMIYTSWFIRVGIIP